MSKHSTGNTRNLSAPTRLFEVPTTYRAYQIEVLVVFQNLNKNIQNRLSELLQFTEFIKNVFKTASALRIFFPTRWMFGNSFFLDTL